MQSSKFIAERKEYWERLRGIIQKIKKRGYRRLPPEEAREFPNLYRKTCTDSETAKTLKLAPDTIEYVNSLVLQAHNLLYTSPKKTFRRLLHFFSHDYPQAFARNFRFIAIMTLLFFGVGAAAFTAVCLHPPNASILIPEFLLDKFEEAPLRSEAGNIFMSGYYIMNNVTLAFLSFLLGITFGLLTLFLIFYNAVVIGGILGLNVASGYGHNLFSFIIAHSSLELLGICIASGAGLALGVALIRSGDEKRSLRFAAKAREVTPLFIMAGIFITLAAFIEGFISASGIPLFVKVAIAAVTFAGIVTYSPLVFWKRLALAARRKRHERSMQSPVRVRPRSFAGFRRR